MSLTLHSHPLSSFCQKVLIGLYELDLPFRHNVVDLSDQTQREALLALWPLGQFPVLTDEARGVTLPETSIILEYVEQQYRTRGALLPVDPERALTCRLRDRFFDLYVNVTMGKIVTDKLRPAGQNDAFGVQQARAKLETAYAIADAWLEGSRWIAGETFTLADCAAAPALFYAGQVAPFERHERLKRYYARLAARPSFARVLAEAEPYLAMFPG
ncbi:MAG TPA: glutathione S-transferase family protein [Polyangiaceae bacterium]|nr:glutathione S-transferase family protein [Polyangiaceae bacterium]